MRTDPKALLPLFAGTELSRRQGLLVPGSIYTHNLPPPYNPLAFLDNFTGPPASMLGRLADGTGQEWGFVADGGTGPGKTDGDRCIPEIPSSESRSITGVVYETIPSIVELDVQWDPVEFGRSEVFLMAGLSNTGETNPAGASFGVCIDKYSFDRLQVLCWGFRYDLPYTADGHSRIQVRIDEAQPFTLFYKVDNEVDWSEQNAFSPRPALDSPFHLVYIRQIYTTNLQSIEVRKY